MNQIKTPPRLDSGRVAEFAANLRLMRGAPVKIDACGTAFVGALGLQVLVCARRQWAEDGHPFEVLAEEPVVEAARDLGLGLDEIGIQSKEN